MSECLCKSVRNTRTRSSVSGTARWEPTAAHASRASAQFKCLSSSLNQPTCKKDEIIMVTRFLYAFEWVSRVTWVDWLAAGWKTTCRISVRILSQNLHKSWICLFDVMWTVTVSLLTKQLQICLLRNVHTRYGTRPDSYSLVTGGSSDRGVGVTTVFPLAPRLSVSEVLLQLSL